MRYRVVVDCPDQSEEHVFDNIDALDEDGAKREAARRAIVQDPFGAGLERGAQPELVPMLKRHEQAADAESVQAVADHATAGQIG